MSTAATNNDNEVTRHNNMETRMLAKGQVEAAINGIHERTMVHMYNFLDVKEGKNQVGTSTSTMYSGSWRSMAS